MNFCTIITPDYIHYALALRESLLAFDNGVQLYIVVVGREGMVKEKVEAEYSNTYIIYADEICREGLGKAIYDKYAHTYLDGFRWSLKPVLLQHLLQSNLDKVIYVDCDIHFYADYRFLFDELDNHTVLLTPHWRSSDPYTDEFHFIQLYIYGLYNAGFIGVNANAIPALQWWAKANLFICEVNAAKGQYVDQSHLNLLPVYFEGVKSLKHRGCNLAYWNMTECERTLQEDGTVLINNQWPIVFIHYSGSTIQIIQDGQDGLLQPFLQVYNNRVRFYEQKMDVKTESKKWQVHSDSPGPGTEFGTGNLYAAIKKKLKAFIR